ncbi:uncharacterized protein LOC135705155 [Ochlerotatus camptorhynchus]|uniref:uncharacterized protein LOC135705155 n=1 Tax=Ochlerotatus camptorhynchus TaxID=644619 RepID=UPI0031D3EAE8
MMRVAVIILAFYTIFCYSYNYAVATLSHKQTSTSIKLDLFNKAPIFQHNTCACSAEAQLVGNGNPTKESTIPSNVCHCRTCVARDSDERGNPHLHCEESTMTEEEFRSLQAQNMATEVPSLDGNHQSKRKKRSPLSWDELMQKIALMGSHDSTYTKRTQGYFHFNYVNSSTVSTTTQAGR